jgi:hypothetical protein
MRAGRQLSASRAMGDFLKKLDEDYDPTDKLGALRRLHESARRGEYATAGSTSSLTGMISLDS